MKTIYPNEKVKLTKGGRNADKLTAPEFVALIKTVYEKVGKQTSEIEDWSWDCPAWIFYMCDYLPKFAKDLKYEFDFENILINDEDKNSNFKESDIKFTAAGTPYLELWCGGDWEKGLVVYVYPSNNTLRAYIPTKGNTVRKDLKCVFGGESEMYSEVDRLTYLKKYAKEDLTEDSIDTKVNPEWCLEDFETRLDER